MINRLNEQSNYLKKRLEEEISNLNVKTQQLTQIYRDSKDVDGDLLQQIQTKVGSICYLKGSIDNIEATLILKEAL